MRNISIILCFICLSGCSLISAISNNYKSTQTTSMSSVFPARPIISMTSGITQVIDKTTKMPVYVYCDPCDEPSLKILDVDEPSQELKVVDVPELKQKQQNTEVKLLLANELVTVKKQVPFASSQYALGPKAKKIVNDLIPLALVSDMVYLKGRADSTGKRNKTLALKRANEIRNIFVSAGVLPWKLKTLFCSDCFITTNDNSEGRKINRRVDVELRMVAIEAAKLSHDEYDYPKLALTSSLEPY